MIRAIATLLLSIFASQALAGETPAGYVVSVALSGADTTARTAIVREGRELPPKLMMPLFAGDVIFLRDAQSRIGIELGDGKEVSVGGSLQRYDVKGEIPTGDDAWSILSAIGSVLAGDEEETPDNMVSKGNDITLVVPMAIHGANLIAKGERKLWLAWTGGEAPFTLSLKQGDAATALPPVMSRETELPMIGEEGSRFSVIITDAKDQSASVHFRLRDAAPLPPESIRSAAPGKSAETLVGATWLMSQDDGAWGIEALQALHASASSNQAAAALLDRAIKGWRP